MVHLDLVRPSGLATGLAFLAHTLVQLGAKAAIAARVRWQVLWPSAAHIGCIGCVNGCAVCSSCCGCRKQLAPKEAKVSIVSFILQVTNID